MSKTEERILKMRFDNEQFGKGIEDTLKDINRLEKGLDLNGAAKGLRGLEDAGRKFSLGGIAEGVDTISSRFTTLGIIGVTALQNITNSAIDAGKRMVSALTIDPIKAGFEEYELKMNSIKTILANTANNGSTLEDVNAALNELNNYSDNTVYNFAQMTDMVSKFASTTGELDSSVRMVKGMSNLAAEAGVENARLQSALYQTSQAMSGAYFQKMDWNSLENAGIATKGFKDDLVAMGKEMGAIDDALYNSLMNEEIGFGMTLEDKWLSTDVFRAVIDMYALDEAMTKAAGEVTTLSKLFIVMTETIQSGWTETWENIVGDREESVKMLNGIRDGFNDLVSPSMDARNAALEFWNANGGRDELIEGLVIGFNNLRDVLGPIGDAFREVFPRMTGERLIELTHNFKIFMESIKMEQSSIENLSKVFKGMFSVLKLLGSMLKSLFEILKPGLGIFGELGNGFLEMLSEWAEGMTEFSNTFNFRDSFEGPLKSLFERIKSLGDFSPNLDLDIKLPKLGIIDKLSDVLKTFKTSVKKAWEVISVKFNPELDETESKFKTIEEVLGIITGVIGTVASAIGRFFSFVGDKLGEAFEGLTIGDVVSNLMKFLAGLLSLKILKNFDNLTGVIGDLFEGVIGLLEGVGDVLTSYQRSLNANTLLKIAGAVAILAGSLIALTFIEPEKLKGGLWGVSVLLAEVVATMAVLDKISLTGVFGASLAVLVLSIAIGNLAKAMTHLKDFQDWDNTWPALTAMIALIGGLVLAAKGLTGVAGKDVLISSLGLIFFATAVGRLAKAIKTFAGMETDELIRGLSAFAVVLLSLTGFIRFSRLETLSKQASMITVLAISLLVLYQSVKLFGRLDTKELAQGLITIMVLVAGLVYAVRMVDYTQISGAASTMMGIAVSLMLLVIPIKMLGNMDTGKLVQGVVGLGVVLAAIIASLQFMSGGVGLKASATSLIAIAGAMFVLSFAIKNLSDLSWKQLAVGLVGILVPLGALVALGAAGGNLSLGGLSLALIGMAGAILVLSFALKQLSSLSWEQLAIGLVAIIAPLAAIGIIGALLIPLAPGLVILAGAFFLFGLAALAASLGIFALSLALTTFAEEGLDGDKAVDIMLGFIEGLTKGINENGDRIIEAVKGLILALISLAIKMLLGSIDLFKKSGDLMMQGLKDGASAMFDLIVNGIGGVGKDAVEAVGGFVDDFFDKGKEFMNNIGAGIAAGAGAVIDLITGRTRDMKEAAEDELEDTAAIEEEIENNTKKYWDNYRRNMGNNMSEAIQSSTEGLPNPEISPTMNFDSIESEMNRFNEDFGAGLDINTSLDKAVSFELKDIPDPSEGVSDAVKEGMKDWESKLTGNVKIDVYNGDTGEVYDQIMAELEAAGRVE